MFKKTVLIAGLITTCVCVNNAAIAAEHEVGQKNKQFTKKELTINVGDTVSFPNQDPFFHNVFSLSEVITFDLGSYPKGETKKIVFDKPGKIAVECAIHPNMQMTITVK